ncbi:MAG: HAMP domain-containing histidine kinase [Cytophagales bacterium]|nr:HAMP domain-containing histidine kinase [Cytophagales bacterium]
MEQPPALHPLARELENERRKNAIIQQLSLVLNRPTPLKEKLDTILEVLDDRFGLRHAMLLLPDPDQPRLRVFSSRGFDAAGIGAEVKFGEGIIGVVALRRKKLRLANISRARIYYSLMADKQTTGPDVVLPGLPNVESQLALPLLVNDELIAVLSVESTDLNFFSPEDEEFLMTLSQLIALSIQNAVVMERLEQKVRERTAALEVQKQELERANASKDRLFAIIGHDLRSPAASLQSTAQLMQYYQHKGNTGNLPELGSRIVKAATSINHLLDNLLNWALTQSGDLQLQPEPIDGTALVTEVMEIYGETAAAKGLDLSLAAPDPVSLRADRNAALTILRNLLGNALKFTRPGGNVRISLRRGAGAAEIEVADDGVGIAPERMAYLYELRENKSTRGTAREKGTGLGLVLVKEMVQLSGGAIAVTSTPGAGTTVSLTLPLHA